MAISVLLGAISAWAIDRHLHDKTEEIESRSRLEQITLLVAARDLSPDTIIEEADVATEQFPAKWASDDAVTLDHLDSLIGKRLLTEVRAGQPLMSLHLIEIDTPGVSSRLGPDRKAVTIVVDAGSAASGLIRDGDRIDLFVSFDFQGKRITSALLQSVEVLTAGYRPTQLSRGDSLHTSNTSSEGNITVAISHKEAVKLVAAREVGAISAILSSADLSALKSSLSPSSGDLAELLGLKVDVPQRSVPILYGDRLSNEQDYESEMEMKNEGSRLGTPIKHAASYK